MKLALTFEGHKVRMFGTPEAPEWVAKDVCRVLHVHHTAGALRDAGVTAEEKGVVSTHTLGGPQEVTTVKEPGLWKLVMSSRKPGALLFRHWLANEVLPSLRKHGCYPPPPIAPQPGLVDMRDPAQLARVALQLTEIVGGLRAKVAEDAPKVESYERLQEARGDMSLSDAARWLGRKPRIFQAQLEQDCILFRGRAGARLPAHTYRERGYFRVVRPEVEGVTRPQTLVTPRGVQWLAVRYSATDRAGSEAIQ